MKRTPLVRKTRLKARRTSKRFAARRDAAYLDYIRALPCLIGQDCEGPTEPDHITTRGAGGDDRGNTYPCCQKHHAERHRIGIESFQLKYIVDLRKWATLLGALE